jgi:hypothetical protein
MASWWGGRGASHNCQVFVNAMKGLVYRGNAGEERTYRSDGEGKQPLLAWLTTYQPVQKEGRKEREEKAQFNCGTTVKRRKGE